MKPSVQVRLSGGRILDFPAISRAEPLFSIQMPDSWILCVLLCAYMYVSACACVYICVSVFVYAFFSLEEKKNGVGR